LLRNSRCGLSRFARADQSARTGEAESSAPIILPSRIQFNCVRGVFVTLSRILLWQSEG